jgi:DNA-binding transcriptional regulator LsrR (DeoR family)
MAGYNNGHPELHIRVAWYYYKAEMTQEQIAQQLGINRARVIKILDQCRWEGVVSFQIQQPLPHHPCAPAGILGKYLSINFG